MTSERMREPVENTCCYSTSSFSPDKSPIEQQRERELKSQASVTEARHLSATRARAISFKWWKWSFSLSSPLSHIQLLASESKRAFMLFVLSLFIHLYCFSYTKAQYSMSVNSFPPFSLLSLGVSINKISISGEELSICLVSIYFSFSLSLSGYRSAQFLCSRSALPISSISRSERRR